MDELLFKQIIYEIVNSILIFLHIKKRTVPNDIDLLKFFRVLRRYQKAGIPMDKALEEYLESNHEIKMLSIISLIIYRRIYGRITI